MGFAAGNCVVVTGAGSGIGRAVALGAAGLGLDVAAWDLDGQALSGVVEEAAELAGTALPVETDVSEHHSVAGALDRTLAWRTPGLLVNNAGPSSQVRQSFVAGVASVLGPVELVTTSWLDGVCERAVAVVNIASVAGTVIGGGVGWYSAGKAGVAGYTRQLAAAAPCGIRVNAIAPGLVETTRMEGSSARMRGGGWWRGPHVRRRYTRTRLLQLCCFCCRRWLRGSLGRCCRWTPGCRSPVEQADERLVPFRDKELPMSPPKQPTSVTGAELVRSLGVPSKGAVYDLSSGWWRHMPTLNVYPSFEVVTYNSPHGERVEGRFPFHDEGVNEVELGYVSELVSGSLHTGTHIDALCHVTCGSQDEWHGKESANAALGDSGAMRGDAAELAPIIGRGVLLDVPRALGLDVLPGHFGIGEQHLRQASTRAGVDVADADVVLVRTGQMRFWPDLARITEHSEGSGVGLDGAQWLLSQGVRYVGADTMSFEVRPSTVPGNPLPVHLLLLQQNGVHIMEWVNCEGLATDGVSAFLFIGLPLPIRGGTGSPLRPVAVV